MTHSENELFRLEALVDSSPIPAFWSSTDNGSIEYINSAFHSLFGFVLADLSDVRSWYRLASRQPEFYSQVIEPWLHETELPHSMRDIQLKLFDKQGATCYVNLCFSIIGNKRFWYFNDVTNYCVAEQRLCARNNMLERVAKSSALVDTLHMLVKQIQYETPQAICSVLLFDPQTQSLKLGAAPNLPEAYNRAIDGVRIGLNMGSCGTAAFLRQRVIVEDVFQHPYWADFHDLARLAGIAACWSDPIISSKGTLLGTFAIYKTVPSVPSIKELELIHFASNLASIAIESFRAQEELERRAYYDHLTGLANRGHFFELCEQALNLALTKSSPVALIMLDVDHFKQVNDLYGHKTGDLVLQALADNGRSILAEEEVLARIGGEEFIVLLPASTLDQAMQKAELLRMKMEHSMVLSCDNQKVYFTVSIGVAYKAAGQCSVDEMLSRADKALYQSKAAGRNCVSVLECQSQDMLF
ncbi:sensor domain-containing diguanylate cyclase [Marinomonas posidonica]|nr:diguanylate cyclase [Marinomonas posidonica]